MEELLRAYKNTAYFDVMKDAQVDVATRHMTRSCLAAREDDAATFGGDEEAASRQLAATNRLKEKLQGENESLRKEMADNRRKIQALQQLAGPLVDRVVYERGCAPTVLPGTRRVTPSVNTIGIRGHLRYPVLSCDEFRAEPEKPKLNVRRVSLTEYRDRPLEEEISAQAEEIDALLLRIEDQRQDFRDKLGADGDSYDGRAAAANREAIKLVKEFEQKTRLVHAMTTDLAKYRIDSVYKRWSQQTMIEKLEQELRDTQGKLAAERKARSAEVARILSSFKHNKQVEWAKLSAEHRHCQVQREAAKQDEDEECARLDKRIVYYTSKLDRLVNDCRRLSSAKHYEMHGLASEVGLVRNDMKMLECCLKAQKQPPAGALAP
ncbi:hypothetical protein DIPPA_15085 [Diplonema papillatum]|nr:hypothetical protein DIPPA_15085 [Diplonema papillatum]KAJ9444162.1 hypothetical protein DIPPA_15085 [Diplonema papillatum]